jgi:hypothetical protein
VINLWLLEKLFLQRTFFGVILSSYLGALLVLPWFFFGLVLVVLGSCLGLGLALVLLWSWFCLGPGPALVVCSLLPLLIWLWCL